MATQPSRRPTWCSHWSRDHEGLASRLGDNPQGAATNRLAGVKRSFDRPAPEPSATALLQACDSDDPLGDAADRLAGWLAEPPASSSDADSDTDATPQPALEPADESEPTSNADAEVPLVPDYLRGFVSVVQPDSTLVGRGEDAEHVLVLLSQRTPSVPLVIAPEGSGRTALLSALALVLESCPRHTRWRAARSSVSAQRP